tara:strand:- start:1037 stop:1636 length:600 start_codon:yes stop_codon:yes gene_type:complete
MEKLIISSKVLYDKDISDKIKEINFLKKNLRFYETPKIEYSNLEEWEIQKKEAYKIIKDGLDEWIIENNYEYQHMSYQGLTCRQRIMIPHYIEKALNIITKEKNKEWVKKKSYDIIYGIEGFLEGFLRTGNWYLIYSQLDSKTLSNLIYNNIIWQLDSDDHYPCILENIAIFSCKICKKKDTYINDDNICFNCERIDLE